MRRVQKLRSKRRGASGLAEGAEFPSASDKAPSLQEVRDLLDRIDEMILGS